jgi:mRNA interferase MazF
MIPFEPGDVVAVEFPFTDFQSYKRRPGLVLAAGEMDLLVARLTTHPPREASDVAMQHWLESGLPRASTIRLTKLVTIDARLVHHTIGRLHNDDVKLVVQAWQQMVEAFGAAAAK